MKKTVILMLSLILTCVIGFGTYVLAESAYITTTATSKIELVPDIVNFDVEVISTSKDSMDKAVNENKKTAAKVYENLNKSINKSNGDNIGTSSYSATSMYKYVNGKKVFDYYQVISSVRVHTKNINNVGKIIDTAMADGATSVNNISYDVSTYESECNKLLSQASQKAKEQAESIAKSIGSEVIGIKSIEGSCSLSGKNATPKILMSAASSANADADNSIPIEIGTVTLNARVNANFFIK